MSITNLTGTKWTFIDEPTNPGYNVYNLTYIVDGTTYTSIQNGVNDSAYWSFIRAGSSQWAYNGNWNYSKTFSVTGGSAATNTTLIAWIEANATQVIDDYSITVKATNATYTGESRISQTGTATVTITGNTGYVNPATITVTNASYQYNRASGLITLSNATGNVTIVAVAETLPISSIANTTWRLNESVAFPATTASYTLNGVATGAVESSQVTCSGSTVTLATSQIIIFNASSTNFYYGSSNEWRYMNSSYVSKTASNIQVAFTTGTDSGNISLMTWLYLNAIKLGHTITFNTNGGTAVSQLTGQNALPNPLPTTTKSGNRFDGWYMDSLFTTPAVAGATISADTTLYAKWAEQQSIEMTAFPGWATLSYGQHAITLKAKASGYADSSMSNSVTITKEVPDLTNTAWKFQDILSPSKAGAYWDTHVKLTGKLISGARTYNFDLINKYGNSSTRIYNEFKNLAAGTQFVYCKYDSNKLNTWGDYSEDMFMPTIAETPTIIITAGEDVKNSYVVDWLKINATQISGNTLSLVPEKAVIAYSTTSGQTSTSSSITAQNVIVVDSVSYTYSQNKYCRLLNAQGEIIQSSLTLPYMPTTDNYKVVAHSEPSGQCIDYYTQVTMADGTTKNLGDIEVGDMVLSIDFDTMKLVDRKVIYSGRDEPDYDQWVTNYYIRNEFSDGSVIKQSMRHRMYNLENKAYVHLDDVWEVGQHCYNLDGTNPTLVRRVFVEEPQHYARITLENCNNYFANGLSTGDSECPTGIVLDHKLTR